MRHRVAYRKLGRRTEHRLSLLRNLAVGLILHERIRTTLAKAKELRPFAERLISLAKKESLHARRQALQLVPRPEAIAKLFTSLSARFADRPGGYTRILKLGPRRGDGAPMAFIELVDYTFKPSKEAGGEKEKAKKEEVKKEEAAPAAEAEPAKRKKAAPARAEKKPKAKAAEEKKAKKAEKTKGKGQEGEKSSRKKKEKTG